MEKGPAADSQTRLYDFGFSVLLGAKTFSFTFWYQLGSEPELSEFEVKVQTYIRADLHTLRPTVSFTCVFFMSRRVLHISYTEHIIFFFFFYYSNFTKLSESRNGRTAFRP